MLKYNLNVAKSSVITISLQLTLNGLRDLEGISKAYKNQTIL
jgi:hypothetical protein